MLYIYIYIYIYCISLSYISNDTIHELNVPKMVRACGVFNIFTSKSASRHNGVDFFNSSTAKRVRTCGDLNVLTSKCASRHNGVRFYNISTSRSGVKPSFFTLLASFREPTFQPSGARKHWKNKAISNFSTFSHT